MDYAFVPGSSRVERDIKTFFRRRPNTVLIEDEGIARVDQFITYLKIDASIVRPIGNILIVAHGTDMGYLNIPFGIIILNLSRGQEDTTTYEVLENADRSGLNHIDPSITGPDTKIYIKGCRIGQAVPFVEKLKACFGGTIPVSAPKHFNMVYRIRDVGMIECLGYDFSYARLSHFEGRSARTDLIAAFQSRNFKFIDGTDVPDSAWNNWLPPDISPGQRNTSFRVNFSPSLWDNGGNEISTYRPIIAQGFRAESQTYTLSKVYSGEAPADRTQQMDALRAQLQTIPRFSPTHPFPVWRRFELDSFDDFIAGFRWTFSRSEDNKTLVSSGTRIVYTLLIPITVDPLGANNLLFNISPDAGNTSPTAPQLFETDTDLYLTV